jgi:peptidyl-prolyl cis-trans isomerase D
MRGIAPWIMVIVALSFVAWMIFEVGMDVTGRGGGNVVDEIARVNGQKIDLQTYYAALRNAQEQQRLQGGALPVTLEEQRALEDAVMEQLVQQALLFQEYRRRGISVSDDEVRQAMLNSPPPELFQVPEFQTDSQFDIEKYQRYLRSGVDPTFTLAIEARYRDEIPRLKLLDRVTSDVYVSDAKLWRVYRDRHDSVTVGAVTLLPQLVVPDSTVDVTDHEVEEYYRAHSEEFTEPARAHISYVTISRLPDAADSAAALQRATDLLREIRDGSDFADVAERESADSVSRAKGGDLGEARRGQFVRPFEEAALALRPGEVSEPVLSAFGYHLIKLESKTGDSYNARHILIAMELQDEHLDEVDSRADSLDLLAATQDDPGALDAAAAAMQLTVRQAGPIVESQPARLGPALVPDAAIWAFEAEPGEISEVIETNEAYYLFRLDSLEQEGVPQLTGIQARVQRAAKVAKQWDLARAVAQEISHDIAQGAELAAAAGRHDLEVRVLGPFTRTTPPPPLGEAPAAVGLAFGLPIGNPGGPVESERAIFFVEPTARQLADSSAFVAQIDEPMWSTGAGSSNGHNGRYRTYRSRRIHSGSNGRCHMSGVRCRQERRCEDALRPHGGKWAGDRASPGCLTT